MRVHRLQIVEAVLAAHDSGELKAAIATGQDGFKVGHMCSGPAILPTPG